MKNESPKIKFLKKGNRIELHADGHRSCVMNIVTRRIWGATKHMDKLSKHVNEKYPQ